MNKSVFILSAILSGAGMAYGQGAIDAYRISQPDMKGTARFMGMGGAFSALGGDLSTLSQNPAGIGIYRSNEVGFTVDLDCQSSTSTSQGISNDMSQTKFLLNNIGAVFTMRLPSMTFPNVNFGFSYNKAASFNRVYGGNIPKLSNSLSNYIAGIANGEGLTENDLSTTDDYDPYNPTDVGYVSPWLPILGYDGYLINPTGSGSDTQWFGQWGNGTSGTGSFKVHEKGAVDEYNIAIGGNISNVVYWGMNFDIVNMNYTMQSLWSESLNDAYVPGLNNEIVRESADWRLGNYYNVHGSGFNYQFGLILKPIQELRFGFSFHTPTWYNLTENFGASIDYTYGGNESGAVDTNGGYLGENEMCFRTPWKLIAGVAGVIDNRLILSLDYEWASYDKMKFSDPGSYGVGSGWGGDWDYDWDPWYGPAKTRAGELKPRGFGDYENNSFSDTNSDIRNYYRSTNTIRVGAEYRVTPSFSLRAGYSYTTSPVKQNVADNKEIIWTSGTMPNYRFDNHTSYITCGAGYRYQRFYVDLAYIYKNMSSEYHAYTPDVDNGTVIPSPQAKLSLNNSQIVLSAGLRF